jgi:phage tail sheath protein FI
LSPRIYSSANSPSLGANGNDSRLALTLFPPCGFVAGICARIDARGGVWKPAAGIYASVNGAAGFAITLSDAQNGQLNTLGVNRLRTLPEYGNVLLGSRTLHGLNDRGSEWKYVPV